MSNSGKNILFIMTGSIACYKACSVISALHQKGYNIKSVLSPSSLHFIGAATIEGLTGEAPITDMYATGSVMDHIQLARWADLILVAPATANYINKISSGIGDDLLTTLFLAHDFSKPFLVAPAMNTKMYLHPTTQNSIQKLREYGVEILETASGVLACGEVGYGRLLDPLLIVNEVERRISLAKPKEDPDAPSKSGIRKFKVLVTAGGTSEPIDDVRVITNSSTGKTAASVADQFTATGAEVVFLHAKNSALPKLECHKSEFYTFQDLQNSLNSILSSEKFDAIIHIAAVSDYSVTHQPGKISSEHDEVTLTLKKNPKLVNQIKAKSPNAKLVAFKLTSRSAADHVRDKVAKLFKDSGCDLVVHNDWADIANHNHRFTIYDSSLTQQKISNVQELSYSLFKHLVEDL